MKNQCLLGLRPIAFSCLLTSAVLAAAPIQAVPVAQAPQPSVQPTPVTPLPATPNLPAAGQQAVPVATITAQDLPAGFKEIPPEIKQQINARLEPFKQVLARENLPVDNFFAFVNQTNFQLVFGFTGMLPNQPQQAKFDAAVQRFQQPQVLQEEMSKLQQKLQSYPAVKLVDYKTLPDLNNKVANTSTGLTLQFDFQRQPVRVDVAGFRRNKTGAFTAVLYPTKVVPLVAVKDVATKLDSRILQLPPAASNSGAVARP